MPSPDPPRTGVCVIRAERDGPTELRITVTTRRDVGDAGCEKVCLTVSIDDAMQEVLAFLSLM